MTLGCGSTPAPEECATWAGSTRRHRKRLITITQPMTGRTHDEKMPDPWGDDDEHGQEGDLDDRERGVLDRDPECSAEADQGCVLDREDDPEHHGGNEDRRGQEPALDVAVVAQCEEQEQHGGDEGDGGARGVARSQQGSGLRARGVEEPGEHRAEVQQRKARKQRHRVDLGRAVADVGRVGVEARGNGPEGDAEHHARCRSRSAARRCCGEGGRYGRRASWASAPAVVAPSLGRRADDDSRRRGRERLTGAAQLERADLAAPPEHSRSSVNPHGVLQNILTAGRPDSLNCWSARLTARRVPRVPRLDFHGGSRAVSSSHALTDVVPCELARRVDLLARTTSRS